MTGDGNGGLSDRPPDPPADAARDPDEEPLTLVGFWDGDRTLWLNARRTHSVEFDPGDVQRSGGIAAGQFPFLGEQATWVSLRPGARIAYARTRAAAPGDGFAVETRVVGAARQLGNASLDCYSYRSPCYSRYCEPPEPDPDGDILFPGP